MRYPPVPLYTGFLIIINALGGQCERGSRINIDAIYLKNGYNVDANLTHSLVTSIFLSILAWRTHIYLSAMHPSVLDMFAFS